MLECKIIHDPISNPVGVFLQPVATHEEKILPDTEKILPDTGEERFDPGSCFFITVDFLQETARLPKQTTAYRHEIEVGYTDYVKCGDVFRFAEENAISKEHVWENNTDLKEKLLKVFRAVLARQQGPENEFLRTLTSEIGNNYIDDFLLSQDLEKASLKKWLQLASSFFMGLGSVYFLGRFAQDKLKERKVSDEELKQVLAEKLPLIGDNLPFEIKKRALLLAILQQKIAQQCGLVKEASWYPSQPCEALINLLQKRGYLMVAGAMGVLLYAVPPKQQQVKDMTVFYWTKDASKNTPLCDGACHTIIVVGAFKENIKGVMQERVFYIDPTYDKDKRPYPIYMTSYKSFCERIGHIEEPLSPKSEGILYYHPKLTPIPQPSLAPDIPTPDRATKKPPFVTAERILGIVGSGIGFWATGGMSAGFTALATIGGGIIGAGSKPIAEKIGSSCCPRKEHRL